jgi:hypothetical protein
VREGSKGLTLYDVKGYTGNMSKRNVVVVQLLGLDLVPGQRKEGRQLQICWMWSQIRMGSGIALSFSGSDKRGAITDKMD